MGFFEFGVLGRMTCKMQSGLMWENTVSHASISEVFKATFKATFSISEYNRERRWSVRVIYMRWDAQTVR